MILARPEYLVLAIIPAASALLGWWFMRRYNRDLSIVAERDLLARLLPIGRLRRERIGRLATAVAASLFLVLAVTGPQWGRQWHELKQQGATVIFVLDTSKSMLAQDLAPSRLERAKAGIADLVAGLRGDRVGLVLFAGGSFLQVPPTSDYAAFNMALESARIDAIPRGGTALAQALGTAVDALRKDSAATKVIFLITDGEDHEGDPIAAAKRAAREGAIVCALGVGSTTGELIPVVDESGNTAFLKDGSGRLVKSSLNEKVLRGVAKAGGGGYQRATNLAFGLEDLYRQTLSGLKKSTFTSKWREQYVDRYQIPLLLGILLLLLELAWGGGKNQAGMGKKKAS